MTIISVLLPIQHWWSIEVVKMSRNCRAVAATSTSSAFSPLQDDRGNQKLALKLVRQLSRSFLPSERRSLEERALEIFSMAKVRFHMHQVEHPTPRRSRWKQLLSHKKRKAVMDCFLAVPYFQLKK